MKLRIYLDTSVLSALGDHRAPDRRVLTQQFFARFPEFEVSTSEVARREIMGTQDARRREEMLALLTPLSILAVTPECQALAARYLSARVMPEGAPADALHVAVAVVTRQDMLVSWNFRHLVNVRRRSALLAMNAVLGLRTPAILSPPEL